MFSGKILIPAANESAGTRAVVSGIRGIGFKPEHGRKRRECRRAFRKTVEKGNISVKAGCKLKICGITGIDDARLAALAGADYAGVLIEVSYSPRSRTVEEALPLFAGSPVPVVALVYGMAAARLEVLVKLLKPWGIQFLSPDGAERAARLKEIKPGLQIWQSLFLPAAGEDTDWFDPEAMIRQIGDCKEAGVDAVVLDTAAVVKGGLKLGGTGKTGRWDYAARVVAGSPLPAFLAGGIKPGNVREAVAAVRPYGIDLCSGVEVSTGKKSLAKMRTLVEEMEAAYP